MRVAANDCVEAFNQRIAQLFAWENEHISWLSPTTGDEYAEYYDDEFLTRLGLFDLKVPLRDFWPRSGPRWDRLARTQSGKVILVEAKAYPEEAVDFTSQAGETSLARIRKALEAAQRDFAASQSANWEATFYQYANRLAHLYYLHGLNGLDAYLLFVCLADAPDVPKPCSEAAWHGALRVIEKCLGLGSHRYHDRVGHVIWSVPEMTMLKLP